MYIYVYVDELWDLVDYFTSIEKFKKRYDGILICPSDNNQKKLGHKKIYNLIKELGYCKLEHKEDFSYAGYLQKVKEGK